MAMHTTVHLTPADVIALVNALNLYRADIIHGSINLQGGIDDPGVKADVLHVDKLIAKLQR